MFKDILELLAEDHRALRRDLERIQAVLAKPELHERIREFIGAMEVHERIEEEILFTELSPFSSLPKGIYDLEEEHTHIWAALERFIYSVESQRLPLHKRRFHELVRILGEHMQYEERSFFPAIRRILDPRLLRELAGKAHFNRRSPDRPLPNPSRRGPDAG